MSDQEIRKDLLEIAKKYGVFQRERERAVQSRRYNLVVFRLRDGEKETVEEIEYLTMRQARELKKEYLAEDNLFSDIIENVTIDRDGKELTFPKRNPVPEVKGRGGFNTPEATQRIIERQRNARRNKAAFKNAQTRMVQKKLAKIKNELPDNLEIIMRRAPGYDKNSNLHEMYLDNVKRNGYILTDKVTGRVFLGMQNEIRDAILYLTDLGRNIKIDLDIRFNGV